MCVVAGERRHEHQQRRLRQVEIGEQPLDDAEAVARRDEEPRFGLAGAHAPVVVGRRLERAQAGRADGDDAAAARARRVDRGDGRRRNPVPLRVHPVRGEVLGFAPAGTCRRRRAA